MRQIQEKQIDDLFHNVFNCRDGYGPWWARNGGHNRAIEFVINFVKHQNDVQETLLEDTVLYLYGREKRAEIRQELIDRYKILSQP